MDLTHQRRSNLSPKTSPHRLRMVTNGMGTNGMVTNGRARVHACRNPSLHPDILSEVPDMRSAPIQRQRRVLSSLGQRPRYSRATDPRLKARAKRLSHTNFSSNATPYFANIARISAWKSRR